MRSVIAERLTASAPEGSLRKPRNNPLSEIFRMAASNFGKLSFQDLKNLIFYALVISLTLISCATLALAGFYISIGPFRSLAITSEFIFSFVLDFSLSCVAAVVLGRVAISVMAYLFFLSGAPILNLISRPLNRTPRSIYRSWVRIRSKYILLGRILLSVIFFKIIFLPNLNDPLLLGMFVLAPILLSYVIFFGVMGGKILREIAARKKLASRRSVVLLVALFFLLGVYPFALGHIKALDRIAYSPPVLIAENDGIWSIVVANEFGVLAYDRMEQSNLDTPEDRWVFFSWGSIEWVELAD